MLFHILSHHTPENCGVHRNAAAADGALTPTITDWGARCKEVGVPYINGDLNAPQHNHFMFVETSVHISTGSLTSISYATTG